MKNLLRRLVRYLGIDIVKYYPTPIERSRAINAQQRGANFMKMLTFKEIDLVLDVGANKGQFTTKLFEIGYQGQVVSFEPLSSAYTELLKASQSNPQWKVAPQCAIGDKTQELEINIAKNSESSSLLPMMQSHLDAAPNSAYIDTEKVQVFRLDDVANRYISGQHKILLKIDTQGYEDRVLTGATGILSNIQGVHLEISLVPLYTGQITLEEMLNKLQNMGFSLYSLSPGFSDYRTGRLLQIMGTFFRD